MQIFHILSKQFRQSRIDDLHERARMHLLRDEPAQAIAAATEAIEAAGDKAELYVCRGRAHYRLGNYAAAVADFDRAVALDHELAAAYANRGLAHFSLGHTEDALGDLNFAAYLNPLFRRARQAVIG